MTRPMSQGLAPQVQVAIDGFGNRLPLDFVRRSVKGLPKGNHARMVKQGIARLARLVRARWFFFFLVLLPMVLLRVGKTTTGGSGSFYHYFGGSSGSFYHWSEFPGLPAGGEGRAVFVFPA